MSKLTEPMLLWAYRQWCAGYTLGEISDALGVTMSAVAKAIQRRGWKKVHPKLEYGITSNSAHLRSLTEPELANELLTLRSFRPYCKNLPSCIRLGDAVPRHRCAECLTKWLRSPREDVQHG